MCTMLRCVVERFGPAGFWRDINEGYLGRKLRLLLDVVLVFSSCVLSFLSYNCMVYSLEKCMAFINIYISMLLVI